MSATELTAGVTAIVALYGAALSTYNLVLARKERLGQMSVKLSFGFLPSGPELGDSMLFIQPANRGPLNVTVTTFGLKLPDGQQMMFPRPRSNASFPHELTQGKSCLIWIPMRELAEDLEREGFAGVVRLVGFAHDATDREYISKPVKFDIKQWLKADKE